MYKLEFLPTAKKDIDDILYYVSNNLKNISAAKKLLNHFIKGANSILEFPFGLSIYNPIGNLKNEYRSVKVKKYLMFYTVDEKEKIITVVRVLHSKRNINNILG